MQTYDPRTISFLCELLHPPQPPEVASIQRIHNRLFQAGSPLYRSFTVTPEGAVLSNPVSQPGAVSSVAFLGDRYQFREELTGLTVDDFAQRIAEMVALVVEERHVQLFTAQVVTIRSLVNPRNFKDSRRYLRRGMFKFGEELQAFGREPQLFGLRLVFNPTQEEPYPFNLRIESLANDPRSLFLENQGTFGPTITQNGLEPITANIQRTYDFLIERALPFLGEFDVRQEA
jgi:hypothetical protein